MPPIDIGVKECDNAMTLDFAPRCVRGWFRGLCLLNEDDMIAA
jgi:hypothetical protein